MPFFNVVFLPEAEAQLIEIYGYIAAKAAPGIAVEFTEGIVAYCESLTAFPLRGVRRTIFGQGCALRTIASA